MLSSKHSDFTVKGFSVVELVTGIALLAVVVFAIIIQLNPFEIAREKRDARLRQDAGILLQAINNFYDHEKRLPWSDDFGGTESRPPLMWTEARQPEVGVCKEPSCREGGDLVEKLKLDLAFAKNSSINAPRVDTLLVGKGKAADNKVYVCFLPNSEDERKNFSELYSLDFEVGITSRGTPLSCSNEVSWKETDICYICL